MVVTGKGGVGKTTYAAAYAARLAAQGKRVLIAMCNAKERVSMMFNSAPIGHEVMTVARGIDAVNMLPRFALEEYGSMVLKSKTVYSLLFDNNYVRAFFDAVPGMHEWSMLGKAWWHTTERDGDRFKYDVVILDAPATGHGIDMLRVPKVIVEVVPTGLLRRDAEVAWNMLRNPTETGIVLVSLAEEMPAQETYELASALYKDLGLPIRRIVANAVLPRLFDEAKSTELASELAQVETEKAGTLTIAATRARREQLQQSSLAFLQGTVARSGLVLETDIQILPYVLTGSHHPDAILEIARHIPAN
jgi:anion-transporting  ArsA/GET3 family ATPase